MKKNGLLLLVLSLSISCFALWTDVSENFGQQFFEIEAEGLEQTRIDFSLSGYEIETFSISGIDYSQISLPDEGENIEVGMPSLPVITRLLAVPATGNIDYVISSLEEYTLTNIELLPRQSIDYYFDNESNELNRNENFYQSGNTFPESVVKIGTPAVLRGVRVVSVAISPFQYDPQTKELKVITDLSVEITSDREVGINPVTREMKRSRFFEPLFESSIINYSTLSANRNGEYQQPCYMFIYSDDELLNLTGDYDLQDVIDWKKQKGFEVHIFSLDETGSSVISIENAIQDAYDDWENPPEFVCLVGDPSSYYELPCSNYSGGSTDHYYSLLDGNDVLADVFIGRLSVDSSTDMKVVANKILGYEKTPFVGNTEWFTDVLLVGDPSSSGPSTISTMKCVKETILNYDDTFTFNEYYSGGAGNFFQTSLDGGVSYFAYRGYLGMSGIPGYINSVNNGWMMPFVSCLTCGTGDFDWEDTSEDFLEAGTPSLPRAGIAAVGTATASTHTAFNNIVTGGMFHGVFHDRIYNPGGALVRGKLALYDNYNDSGGESASMPFFYWNNLMGDPGIQLWTGVPQDLTVIYNDEISVGSNYLEVYVEDSEGFPLGDAWVTAYNEEMGIAVTGFTDASGLVYLNINADQSGSISLTVTSQNAIPHLGEFTVILADQYLGIEDILLDDDQTGNSSGNNDGLLNPGETIELGLGIKNSGYSQVDGVTATLTCDDPAVSITTGTQIYGEIPAGQIIFSDDDFVVEMSNTLYDGDVLAFQLDMVNSTSSTWTDLVFLTIVGTKLVVSDYDVEDGSNGVLEPGETADLEVSILNNGQISISGLEGTLNCNDQRITINDPDGYWGYIAEGQQSSNGTDLFNISANYSILPGSQIPMSIDLSNTAGFEQTLEFNIVVGIITQTDPLGPDAYGYYAYDDSDVDYPDVPEYNWIEIDPDENNPDYYGTIIDMNIYSYPNATGGSGDIETVDLPPDFSFQYYGVIYDEISICSNGFITPGYSENFEFMNWHIPGPHGPSSLIAPFWDELHFNNNTNVCYFYNQIEHYVVVEWNNTINQQNDNETFQVILYDSNFYNTTTNDSKIKFQYKEIDNSDTGSYGYPVNHGLYATVGIVDHTNSVGLEYSFNNDYPTAAKPLQDEMAILFAPTPIPTSGPYVYVSDLGIVSGSDVLIEAGETAYFSSSLKNIGPDVASNVSMELILEDEYVTITDANETFGNIASGEVITIDNAYTLEVSDQVPDQHFISIAAVITSDEEIWERNINLVIYAFPALGYDPDSYYVELDENQTYETTLELTNTVVGSGALSYELRTEPIDPSSRSLEGSYIESNLGTFEPGETVTWIFTAYNWSTDNEWVTDINIHFPYGVTVTSATDFVGGSGGDMEYDGTTGENVELNWHGSTALGYGYLHQNQHAIAEVDVVIDDYFSGNIVLTFELVGDGYGEDPHTATGEMTLYYPLGWISIYPPVGVITGGETDVLDVTFDTSQLTYGTYNCEIIINIGDTYEPSIPVTLNVVSTDAEDTSIPATTVLQGNHPNPFNPETVISYQLSEDSRTELLVYNIKGQLVRTLVNDDQEAGVHSSLWDGKDDSGNAVTSGVYFYKLQAGKYSSVKKMILMK